MIRTARGPRVIVGVLAFFGLLFAGAAAMLLVVDPNDHKAWLESAASRALGMNVSIGHLGIALSPGVLITLQDVHVQVRGVDVASAKEARLAIALLPLLKKEIRVEKIELKFANISVERDRRGQFNFEPPGADAETLPALSWPSVSLADATFLYADEGSGDAVNATDCRVDLHRVQSRGGTRSGLLKDLSFSGELRCGQVHSDGFVVSDVKSSVDAKNGVLELTSVTTRFLATQGSGSIRADFSSPVPSCQVRYSLSQFPIEDFFKTMSLKKIAMGRVDFSANVSMQGTSANEMRRTMRGKVSLRGRNLTLIGGDLDAQFSRFESSQNFNLVDVGAFLFVGPFGPLVTKGYDFASLSRDAGTSSEIPTLVSEWNVERGVAQAQDVALATKQNRIALRGGLDFANARFDGVSVALVDSRGCAKVQQKISGTFRNPVVDKPNVVASLAGPALTLLKKGRDLILGGRCDAFYAGSVAAPR